MVMTAKSLIFLCIVLTTFATERVRAEEPLSLFEGSHYLAQDLGQSLSQLGKGKVAVVDLVDLSGESTYLGKFFAEKLTTAFVDQGSISVVERQLLGQMMEEFIKQESGIIDIETAKEVGRLAGADYIVAGTTTALSTFIDINVRVISLESGDLIASSMVKIIRDEDVEILLNTRLEGKSLPIAVKPKEGDATEGPEGSSLVSTNPLAGIKSAISIPLNQSINTEALYERAQQYYAVDYQDGCVMFETVGVSRRRARIYASGELFILSPDPLRTLSDMDAFFSESVELIQLVGEVEANLGKEPSAFWVDRTVYNSTPNVYQAFFVTCDKRKRYDLVLSIPKTEVREARISAAMDCCCNFGAKHCFVTLGENQLLSTANYKLVTADQIANQLFFGDHKFTVHGASNIKGFFGLEVMTSPQKTSIILRDLGKILARNQVLCLSLDDLRLPDSTPKGLDD